MLQQATEMSEDPITARTNQSIVLVEIRFPVAAEEASQTQDLHAVGAAGTASGFQVDHHGGGGCEALDAAVSGVAAAEVGFGEVDYLVLEGRVSVCVGG